MSTCFAVCAAMRPKAVRACFTLRMSPNSLVLLGAPSSRPRGCQKIWKPSSSPSSASRPALLRVLERDLALVSDDVVDDGHVLEEIDLAGVLVEAGLELARSGRRRSARP